VGKERAQAGAWAQAQAVVAAQDGGMNTVLGIRRRRRRRGKRSSDRGKTRATTTMRRTFSRRGHLGRL